MQAQGSVQGDDLGGVLVAVNVLQYHHAVVFHLIRHRLQGQRNVLELPGGAQDLGGVGGPLRSGKKLAAAVIGHLPDGVEEIDALISTHLSKGWKISRISRISLAIMRVAVYEMKNVEEVPVSVAINEAVVLAKKYSVDDASFINGVLGAIAKELE